MIPAPVPVHSPSFWAERFFQVQLHPCYCLEKVQDQSGRPIASGGSQDRRTPAGFGQCDLCQIPEQGWGNHATGCWVLVSGQSSCRQDVHPFQGNGGSSNIYRHSQGNTCQSAGGEKTGRVWFPDEWCQGVFCQLEECGANACQHVDLYRFPTNFLVGQDLLNFLEYMSNDQSMQHVRKMLPKIVPLLGPFKSSIQEGAKKVISSATKSIASFLAKLQKTDVKLAELLTEELVGKTEDDGEENTKDVIKIPYGQIFKYYFEDLPSGKRGINVPLESEDDGTKLLSAGVLCQGAAVFPLAKKMAQLSRTLNKLKGKKTFAENLPASVGPKSNELLVDSKLPFLTSEVALKVKLCLKALGDASSNVELIQIEKSVFSTIGMTFLAQAKEHLLSNIKDIVNETNTEFGNIKAYVMNLISAALTEFKLTEVNTSDAFEPSLVSKACQDNRFHQLYNMCLVGKNALVDSRAMLKNLSESCKSSFANDCTSAVQWAEAGIADFSSFLDGGVEKQNTLNFVGCVVGTVTLVQSLTRDLNTGKTRQTLVHRSLQATKRLGVPLNKAIVSKCESIISGKPSKWTEFGSQSKLTLKLEADTDALGCGIWNRQKMGEKWEGEFSLTLLFDTDKIRLDISYHIIVFFHQQVWYGQTWLQNLLDLGNKI